MKNWLVGLCCLAAFSANVDRSALASKKCKLEQDLLKAGLVDVHQMDSSVRVQLRYATTSNFLNQNIYGCLTRAYLQKEVAQKLAKASALLQKQVPALRLLIWDAARPKWAQEAMWRAMPFPENKKHIYLANPKRGSIHNYGCAVDLTICYSDGKPIDMGTDFDFFGVLAQPILENQLLKEGRLTKNQLKNRQLLRSVMKQAGFFGTNSEWWHFNAYSLRQAKQKHALLL